MASDLTDLLDELDAAREKATPGPWAATSERADGGAYIDAAARGADSFHVLGIGHAMVAADAALIVAAVNTLPRLAAALRAVLDLADHYDQPATPDGLRALHGGGWVCHEIRAAIAATLTPESER